MTVCPTCRKSYTDDSINFCTEDGAALMPVTQGAASADSLAGTSPLPDYQVPSGTDVHFPPPVDPLKEGSTVGEYVVGRKIGEGGMGVIYAGIHPIIGKKIALKVLNPQMASSPEVVQRFVLEARAVNQIGHRNIIDIFSFGKLSDGRHYFAMEFLDGGSLASLIARDVPVPWSDAIQIWIQVAGAIEAAHQRSIVHRDLKPDNVFVTPTSDGPFVKVLDFGIAKLVGDVPTGMHKTSTGVPIGTPAYMSPEQVRGGNIDNRTDIYSFGLILYETIAGRPPFLEHNSFVAVLTAQLSQPPPALAEYTDVRPELADLVERCLAKDPDERPPNMTVVREELVRLRDLAIQEGAPMYAPKGELAKLAATGARSEAKTSEWFALDEATRQMPAAAAAAAPAATPTVAEPPPTSSRAGLFAGGALLLVAALGGAVVATRRPARPAPVPAAVAEAPPKVSPPPTAAPTNGLPPNTGRLVITTGVVGTRVYLDKSATDRAAEPAAAGGMVLKVQVPSDVDWILRVEADGYKPVTMPLKIVAGEETALPVVMAPVVADKVRRATPGGARPPRPAAANAPQTGTPEKKGPSNSNILDPFN
jgi:serine/threonine-protein kinase